MANPTNVQKGLRTAERRRRQARRCEDVAYFLTLLPEGSARDFIDWIHRFARKAGWEARDWPHGVRGRRRRGVPYPQGRRAAQGDIALLGRTAPSLTGGAKQGRLQGRREALFTFS